MSALIKTTICLLSISLKPITSQNFPANFELPLVISTWDTLEPVSVAYNVLRTSQSIKTRHLDALEAGIGFCEQSQCRHAVGFGGKPDENGETTLDAMIMDGETHAVGAVGCLRRIKPAISVARKILDHTNHNLLVGDLATQFAINFGFKEESLVTNYSKDEFLNWKQNNCQPNFWKPDSGLNPDPETSCGPYFETRKYKSRSLSQRSLSPGDHDTIGMIVIDQAGKITSGTSTNGLNHKIPGRVGDSPIPGSGSYVDKDLGAAAATGDGDIMMRLLPSYQAVESMRSLSAEDAAKDAMMRIKKKFPKGEAAIIVSSKNGSFAASCTGYKSFPFVVQNPITGTASLFNVTCI